MRFDAANFWNDNSLDDDNYLTEGMLSYLNIYFVFCFLCFVTYELYLGFQTEQINSHSPNQYPMTVC